MVKTRTINECFRCSNSKPKTKSKTYEEFSAFKHDVLTRFKPKESSTKLTANITSLIQKQDETVKVYGDRVVKMKDKYIDALYAEYEKADMELTLERSAEAEKLVVEHFLLGLKQNLRTYIKQSDDDDILTAISKASSAETSRELTMRLHRNEESMTEGKKWNVKPQNSSFSKQNYRNSSTNWQQKKPSWQKSDWTPSEKRYDKHPLTQATTSTATQNAVSDYKRSCYNCGSTQHLKKDCPKQKSDEVSKAKVNNARSKDNSDSEGESHYSQSKNGTGGSAVSASALRVRRRC